MRLATPALAMRPVDDRRPQSLKSSGDLRERPAEFLRSQTSYARDIDDEASHILGHRRIRFLVLLCPQACWAAPPERVRPKRSSAKAMDAVNHGRIDEFVTQCTQTR